MLKVLVLCSAYFLYGSYVLDFGLDRTLCPGTIRAGLCWLKAWNRHQPHRIDQFQETVEYNAQLGGAVDIVASLPRSALPCIQPWTGVRMGVGMGQVTR